MFRCQKTKFWLENPINLLCSCDIVPLDDMILSEQMNAITRLIFIVFLILILFNFHSSFLFLLLSLVLIIIGGLLVGLGTRMGGGCTSGHGICGISRFSIRSIVATITFILTAMLTVFILQQFGIYK